MRDLHCDPADVIDHPSGYLALSARNHRFTVDRVPGFIAYREQGKHLIFLGGVHAARRAWEALLDTFIAEAEKKERRLVGVQLPKAQVDLFRERGFTVNQFGSTYALLLRDFSFAGTARLKLRNKLKRARQAGLRVVEVGRDLPADEATFAELKLISDAWLGAKRKKELDFMIGEIGTPEDRERRIFTVIQPDGQKIGFITYVPVWGCRPGYLHDLTRRIPDAPVGAMELCNAHALELLMAEGAQYLHFGFTPFVVDERKDEKGSALVAHILRILGRYGKAIYPAQSQVSYKLKWGPQFIEPEYLAFKPLSFRAIIDLLILTRSV